MAETKTPEQKAAEREARKAAKQAAQAARWEQEKKDKAIMLDALRTVIVDDTATPAQRLFAVAVLDYAENYHMIPYSMKYPDSKDDADFTRLRAKFAAELKAAEERAAEKKGTTE